MAAPAIDQSPHLGFSARKQSFAESIPSKQSLDMGTQNLAVVRSCAVVGLSVLYGPWRHNGIATASALALCAEALTKHQQCPLKGFMLRKWLVVVPADCAIAAALEWQSSRLLQASEYQKTGLLPPLRPLTT
jgi:hypothetical protein